MLPEGEPEWLPVSFLSFRVTTGRVVEVGMTNWGGLSRTVKSAVGQMKNVKKFDMQHG